MMLLAQRSAESKGDLVNPGEGKRTLQMFASRQYPWTVTVYGFCLEFVVPPDADIGHPDRIVADPKPNLVLEDLRATLRTDDRWTMLRVNGSNPTLFVCVAVEDEDEESARSFVQGAVYDVVTDMIPGARFVNIEATNPPH
jgi:hypothetical protein